jgi:hypothetical protein
MFSLVIGGRHRFPYDSLVFSRSERQSTENMAGSVFAREIRVWKSLPVSARSSLSLQGFNRIVRDFLGISNWGFANGYCYFSIFFFFILHCPSISFWVLFSILLLTLSLLLISFLSFLISLYSLSLLFSLIFCPFLYSALFSSSTLIVLIGKNSSHAFNQSCNYSLIT